MESMEARTGDGPKEAAVAVAPPKDRRLPLALVVFNTPTYIPGSAILMTNVEAGVKRSHGGLEFTCPQAFYDPTTRTISIGECEYPLERVHYWRRARMASSKIKPGY